MESNMNKDMVIRILLSASINENLSTNSILLNKICFEHYPLSDEIVKEIEQLTCKGYLINSREKLFSNNGVRNIYLGQLTPKGNNYLKRLLFDFDESAFIENNFYGPTNITNLQIGNRNKIIERENEKRIYSEYGERLLKALSKIMVSKNNIIKDASLYLGFDSPEDFIELVLIKKYPDFHQLEWIADQFGINRKWLLKNESYMFKPNFDRSMPIIESKVNDYDSYFFIIKKEEKYREIMVIHRLEKYRYIISNKELLFRSNVGGRGMSRLYEETYLFLKSIEHKRMNEIAKVMFLSTDIFNQIKRGEIYVGNFLEDIGNNNILEDFVLNELDDFDQKAILDIRNIRSLVDRRIQNRNVPFCYTDEVFRGWNLLPN